MIVITMSSVSSVVCDTLCGLYVTVTIDPKGENLGLGIESWVLFYRGFTILGFSCTNGSQNTGQSQLLHLCKCDNI
jgi:hypothetical protein